MNYKVVLNWQHAHSDTAPEAGFSIMRRPANMGQGEVEIGTTQPGVKTYEDLTVTYGASYTYLVASYNDGGKSIPAVLSSMMVTVPAPPSPTGLTGAVSPA